MLKLEKPKLGKKITISNPTDMVEKNGEFWAYFQITVIHDGVQKVLDGLSKKAIWKIETAFSQSETVEMGYEFVGQYCQYIFEPVLSSEPEPVPVSAQVLAEIENPETPCEKEYGISDDEYASEVERLVEGGMSWNDVYETLDKKYRRVISSDESKFHINKLAELEEKYQGVGITDIDTNDSIYMSIVQDFKEKGRLIQESVSTKFNFTY